MELLGKAVRIAVTIAVVLVALLFVGRLLVSVTGGEPPLGTGFAPDEERGGCPPSNNCVSSLASTAEHAIDPIACNANEETSIAVFADAMETLPDAERTSDTAWVAYSRWLRFPDDVRIQVSRRGIEVFSSSRLGAGGLGINRERVEELRASVTADPRCGLAEEVTE